MDDLIPCPFCGGDKFTLRDKQVTCAECGARGPEFILIQANTPDELLRLEFEEATRLWSQRAKPTP